MSKQRDELIDIINRCSDRDGVPMLDSVEEIAVPWLERKLAQARLKEARLRPHEGACHEDCNCERGRRIAELENEIHRLNGQCQIEYGKARRRLDRQVKKHGAS